MDSHRTSQISEVLRGELSQIIARKIDFARGSLVTITRVETKKDLKHANVFVSILPNAFVGKNLEILKRRTPMLQGILNKKLAIGYVPQIYFKMEEKNEIYN